jgi:hypothetical protein
MVTHVVLEIAGLSSAGVGALDMKIYQNLIAAAVMAAASTIAAEARADQFFWLTQGECAGNCSGTPGNTAPSPISTTNAIEGDIDLISPTSATVTFTVPTGGKITTPLYINVNDFNAVGNVTATVNVPGSVFRADPGQAEDHYGNMNVGAAGGFSICASGCTATSLVFTLTDTNSNPADQWTSANDVLMQTTGFAAIYGQGFDAATASYSDPNVTTTQYAGFYVNTTQFSSTPLPATLPLFAGGLGFLGYLGKRRRQNAKQALAAA